MTFMNEGMWDRAVRSLAGILLLYGGWMTWPGALGILLLVVGAVALITGLVGWCPAYALFNLSTKKAAA